MSEPTESTLEEASRCPRCKEPGKFDGERSLGAQSGATRGAKLKMFMCMNQRCRWYNTTWSVQVNADGTIPPALLNRPKQFTALPDDGGRVLRNLERQLEMETRGGGGEVPNR